MDTSLIELNTLIAHDDYLEHILIPKNKGNIYIKLCKKMGLYCYYAFILRISRVESEVIYRLIRSQSTNSRFNFSSCEDFTETLDLYIKNSKKYVLKGKCLQGKKIKITFVIDDDGNIAIDCFRKGDYIVKYHICPEHLTTLLI
jgi:hypothetical protein